MAIQQAKNDDQNRKRKGFVVSLVVHVLFLLIMLGFTLEAPFPPPLELGIAIQFGGEHDGMGKTDQNQTERAVSAKEQTSLSKPEHKTQKQNVTDQRVVTQSQEEAPSMRSEKPNPQKQRESTPIDQRALFPGSRSQEKSGQNEAAGRKGSRDGKPQGGQVGDPRNNGLIGTPDFSLQGRNLLFWDKPNDDTQLQGVVVLNVTVNLRGQVVQAELNTKKSTISRPDLVEKCKLSARKFKFSATDNQTAPPLQSGTITFRFELD
jgi:hypothetical protein